MANLSLVVLVLLASTVGNCSGFLRRVCYYGSWNTDFLYPSDINAHLCSHMIFAFATLDSNGTHLQAATPSDEALFTVFTHVLKHKNRHLKTMLGVGGWNMASKPFVKTVKSETNMRKFAINAVKFLRAHNFDGLDIDWEYPADRGSGPEDKANFVQWLDIVHHEFLSEAHSTGKPKLILSIAAGVSEHRVYESYDIPGIMKSLDFVNLMMYDFHGEWEETANVHSALYSDNDFNVNRFVKNWADEGAPKNKLVVGIPLYGRTFTLADSRSNPIGANTTGGGDMAYRDICKLIKDKQAQEHMLSTERVPYVTYDDQFIGFDNIDSVTEKAKYIVDNGYGGAMVWAIELDDYNNSCGNGSYPLMHAIARVFSQPGVIG